MVRTTLIRIALAAGIAVGLASTPALAGTMSLTWDPVSDNNLAGYRVYYGTSPGNYTTQVDVGLVTEHTLSGLVDCTTWYVGVKSYDTNGDESDQFSNEVSGWPRPDVANAAPASIMQGEQIDITLTGSNFKSGSTVTFSNSGLQINSVNVSSCSSIVVNVSAAQSAALGTVNVDVDHPDGVYGTGEGLLSVAAAPVPPSFVSHPANRTVVEGQTATFNVVVNGSTPLNYQWQRDGADISGATASSYTTPPTVLSDDGASYRCEVTNPGGSATSDPAVLTVLDGTPPVISQISSSSVTDNTATINWTTDETADGQVLYRPQGTTSYQASSLDSAQVTSHSIDLTSLTAGTTYEYRVQSTDAAGNTATSSPDRSFTTTNTNQPPSASFTASSTSGEAPLTVSFDASGSGDPDGTIAAWDWDFGDGATGSGVTASHTFSEGTFTVVLTVTDDDSAEDTSSTVIVVSEPAQPPTIVTHPTNQTVVEGQSATFTVVANGVSPVTYQWQRDGTDVSGATSSSYTTPPTVLADNGASYRCVVTNPGGTVTSNPAGLTVLDGTAPVITQVAASAITDTTATITWATDEPADGQVFYRPQGTASYQTSPLDSTPSTSHSITLASLVPGTTYECRVQSVDAAGNSATSSPDQLFTTTDTNQAPTASLTATPASGDSPLAVSFDGSGSSDPDGTIVSWDWDFGDGATASGVTVSHTYTTGTYTAILTVTDDGSTTDTSATTIQVNAPPVPPSIQSHPSSQTVVEGQSATFTVTASGTGPLGYQWQRDGADVPGATSASYTTPPNTLADDGASYRCVVSNTAGSATSNSAQLTVLDGTAPAITQVATSGVAETSATVTWATNEPADSQVFYRPVTQSSYLQTNVDPTLVTSHSVPLTGLDPGTTYVYHVRSADALGNVATSTPDETFTTQTVNQTPVASFTASPTNGEPPLTVSFDASGSDDPDGTIVSWAWDFGDGNTASGLTASHQYTAAGFYAATLTVTDDRGATDTSTTTIDVEEPAVPPTIDVQPVDQTVPEGDTATFTINAQGTAPLSYQWRRDGTDVAGASQSTYTTPPTGLSDDGATFDCVVTNVAGSATSNSATLSVSDVTAPSISQVQNLNVTETTADVTWITDEPADSQVLYRPVGDATYQQTTLDPALVTSHAVSLGGLAPGITYEYHVRSADASGNVSTSQDGTFTTTSVVNQPPSVGITASPLSGDAPLTVSFDGSGSSDADGTIAAWNWAFGDGSTAQGATTSHTFTSSGSYDVTLTVTDDDGAQSSGTETITVNEPTTPAGIVVDPTDVAATEGASAAFTVVADGTPPLSYQWQRDGADIAGADTPIYRLPSVSSSDDGSTYACVVSNASGSAVSAFATLTVRATGDRVQSSVVALYTFEEGQGDVITDVSRTGEPLDLTVAKPSRVTWVPSGLTVDTATVFDSGVAATKIIDAVRASGEVTVEVWVRPTGGPQSASGVVTMADRGSSRNLVLGQSNDTWENRFRSTATDTAGNPGMATPAGSTPDAVTHVAFTRDASGLERLYVDGVESTSRTVAGDLSAWDDAHRLLVANEISGNRGWLGTLHLVAFYDRALAPLEIDQNFVAGPLATAPPIPPVVDFTATPTSGDAPLVVSFDASASTDPDGTIVAWDWDFGDGGSASGPSTTNTYVNPGTYTVTLVLTDDDGATSSATETVSVTIPATPPSITTAPVDQTVTEGQTATFSVAASGTSPLAYQWQRDGADLPGATGPSYTTSGTTLADNGSTYRCVVTNSVGSAISSAATLTVLDGTAPVISQVSASGITDNGATITWTTDEPADSRVLYRVQGTAAFQPSATDPTPTTSHSISLGSLVAGTTYEYIVESTDPSGNTATSSPFQTFVTTSTNQLPSASFTATPTSGESPLSVSFDGSGSNDPDGTIVSWNWDFGDGATAGGTTPSHTYSAGTYTVILTVTDDSSATDTATTTIQVTEPAAPVTIVANPADSTVTEGETATFTVSATGTPPLGYQWERDGVVVPGANQSSYTTPATTVADNGSTYRCVVTNSVGAATSSAGTLTVLDGTSPVISQVAASNISDNGATITWSTNEPADGQVLYRPQGTSAFLSSPLSSTPTTSHSITLSSLIAGATYEYAVQSTDPAGNAATSSPYQTFTTTNTNQPPTASFSATPTSGESPLTVSFDATSSADSDGTVASWDWDFGDGATGSGATTSHTYSTGTFTAILTVTDDRSATATSSRVVVVSEPTQPPTIVASPTDASVTEGQSATFSVVASGSPPLDYQWQRDGADIPGATAPSYTTAPTTIGDSGSVYRCVVSNNGGSVTSNTATLTVLDGTGPVLTQVTASGITEGSAVVSWTTDEPADTQVFYRRVGDSGYLQTALDATMVTGHYATLTNLLPDTPYEFHVRSTDAAGNESVSTPDSTFATDPNAPPTASFIVDPTSDSVPVQVHFNASASTDAGGNIVSYAWDFGDGTTGAGVNVVHSYDVAGSYTVILTVTDNRNATDTSSTALTFSEPVQGGPNINRHPVSTTISPGETATFSVTAHGPQPLAYQWRRDGQDISGATSSSYTTPPVTLADSGASYRCVVSNPAGTATSNPATLTVIDIAGPSISDVQLSDITETSVTVTWTTGEPSSSQVFYRPIGTASHQFTTFDPTLVSDHQVVVQGLTPGVSYELYVRSADALENATTSPHVPFTTTAVVNVPGNVRNVRRGDLAGSN